MRKHASPVLLALLFAGFAPAGAATTCAGLPITITATAGLTSGTAGDDVIDASGVALGIIDAQGGDDVVCAGDGSLVILGGEGRDTLSFENTSLIVIAHMSGQDTDDSTKERTGSAYKLLSGLYPTVTAGVPGVDAFTDIEVLIGSPQSDFLVGTALEGDEIRGGAGDDTIIGLWGDDILYGDEGNDTLLGDGYDEVTYDLIEEQKIGSVTKPELATDNDRLYGGAGDDALNDDTEDNYFNGGPGDDSIGSGYGDDEIDGGGGRDIASFSQRAVKVNLNRTGVQDTGMGMDKLINVEDLLGSPYDDILIGNADYNIIRGGAGNDFISGREGPFILAGTPSTITWGGSDIDTLDAGAGDDSCAANSAGTFYAFTFNCENVWGPSGPTA